MKFPKILALISAIQTLVAILEDGTIDEAEKAECADALLSVTQQLLSLKGTKKVKIKARANYDYLSEKMGKPLMFDDVHLTHQSMKDACDINQIIKRLGKHGIPLPPPSTNPIYMDLSGMPDFHTALNVVTKARQDFDRLDPFFRARFGNQPERFIEWALDAQNIPEMVKLGLAKAPVPMEGKKPNEMDSGASAGNSGNSPQAETQGEAAATR